MKRTFKEALGSGDFVITGEVGPPKGTNIDEMVHNIELLKDKVDGLNVTDNQSSVMRISSLAVCSIIRQKGGEPVLQMTCRDRNRLAIQSDLLGAQVLGVDNVLCLTGDYITVGDHADGKPVFDLDSVLLIQTVRGLEQGKDFAGNDVSGTIKFTCGAVVTPEADPLEPQLMKFEKKIKAGAEFFQTQAIYDLDNFKRFMDFASKFDVKILAGIIPLISPGMAKFMNANVPGVQVPDNLIDEMVKAPKGEKVKKGVEIAARMLRKIKEEKLCHGAHVMAIGREKLILDIMKEAGM
jgi:methylenetetrahydrofolate reductase (NADPH)